MFDTNIFVSALLTAGLERRLVNEVGTNLLLFSSEEIMAEVSEVIARPKFCISIKEQQNYLKLLKTLAVMVTPQENVSAIKDDPDDNKIIDCAVEAKAKFIVSGDKHLLSLKQYGDIAIIKSREMINMIGEHVA